MKKSIAAACLTTLHGCGPIIKCVKDKTLTEDFNIPTNKRQVKQEAMNLVFYTLECIIEEIRFEKRCVDLADGNVTCFIIDKGFINELKQKLSLISGVNSVNESINYPNRFEINLSSSISYFEKKYITSILNQLNLQYEVLESENKIIFKK